MSAPPTAARFFVQPGMYQSERHMKRKLARFLCNVSSSP